MRAVSERFAAAIGGMVRWETVVDWTNDGGLTWNQIDGEPVPLEFVSGTVTADATAVARWHCQLQVRTDAPIGVLGINPFSTQLRVRHGIRWSSAATDTELLGMGKYRLGSISRSLDDPGLVTVTGDSFEQYLDRARLTAATQLPIQEASARLDLLIRPVIADATIHWDGVSSRILPAFLIEQERWQTIGSSTSSGSVARALGAQIFCNGDGAFIVRKTPSLSDTPVWSARKGEVLVSSTEDLDSDQVYNRIVVTGESTDEDAPPVGPGIRYDSDPESPTYYWRAVSHGGFGSCTKYYNSQLIRTMTQARATAQSMLDESMGLRQTIGFDSLHDPRKEPGDVGIVTAPDGRDQRVILDSVTYDLLGAPLSCGTRTTRTSLYDQRDEVSDEGDDS